MTANYGLTEVDKADLHARLVSWFGDDRQAFLVSHLAPVVDRIKVEACAQAATESQWNALEMAYKAEQAERRAKDAEAAFERLRTAADKVGHQAVCPVDPCDCWMRDLAPLLDACEWCGVYGAHANGCRLGLGPNERGPHRTDCNCAPPYAECGHPPCACTACVDECSGLFGEHHWLDRPESDTRECLICGTEAAG